MSSIANMKNAMGWQHPNQGDCCANCRHVLNEERETGFCKPAWYCDKGGFFTPAYALCKQFEAKP